jgi:energy-coupling factor transporter ATP-binding protein EcfA2
MSSRDRPLPPDLHKAFGDLQELQYKGGNEWSSYCPECGDSGHNPYSGKVDRFHIHASDPGRDNARGVCRQCGVVVFATSNYTKPPNRAELQKLQDEYENRQALEAAQMKARLDEFIASKLWEFFANEMTSRERWMWEKIGIPPEYQKLWKLGYMKHYPSKQFNSDALTIPYFSHDGDASNLQYRLLQPPQPQDRYRFTKGLKPGLFLAEPDREFKGKCLVVEGAKKSMVTWRVFIDEASHRDWSIIALPSAQSYSLLPQLEGFEAVWIVLDPDQYRGKKNVLGHEMNKPITKFLRRLMKVDIPEIYVAKPPQKIDDAFVKYGATAKDFMAIINQSYRVRPKKIYAVYWEDPANRLTFNNPIDDVLRNMIRGDILMILGRTGHGKTSLMLAMAKEMSNRIKDSLLGSKDGIAIFASLEQNVEHIELILAGSSEMDSTSIVRGKINRNAKERYLATRPSLPLWVLGQTREGYRKGHKKLYLEGIIEAVEGIIFEYGKHPVVLFLDYLQVARIRDRPRMSRHDQVMYASEELKALALRLDIPIIYGSQSTQLVDNYADKQPRLTDSAWSGEASYVSDQVISTQRDWRPLL